MTVSVSKSNYSEIILKENDAFPETMLLYLQTSLSSKSTGGLLLFLKIKKGASVIAPIKCNCFDLEQLMILVLWTLQ